MTLGRIILLLRFVSVLGPPTSSSEDKTDAGCNDNIRIDNYCYVHSKQQLSWSRAKYFCESQGMVLARTENLRNLSTRVRSKSQREFFPASFGIWVGASDVDVEGKYIWIDNFSPVAPELWAPGFPNNNNSYFDCVHIDHNFFIRNSRCTRRYDVMCQYSIAIRSTFQNSKFLCHCSSGRCTETGQCQNPDDRCESDNFGPKCQFKNLDSTMRGTAGVLQDNDDKTCLNNMTSPLEIKLETQQPFSWLRVVMKEKGQLKSFELSFSTAKNLRVGSDKRTEKCRDPTYIVQDELTLDIRCYIEITEIDKIFLTWKGNKSICSVYIYGGRNLSFKQEATQSGSDPASAALAVDGQIGINSNCTRGDPALKNHTWQLLFPFPVVIFKFVMFRRKGRSGFNYMNGFVLETLTLDDEVVFSHTDDKRDQEPIAKITSDAWDPVQKVRVRLDKTSPNSRYLEICELIIYGECSAPKYGLTCSEECLPTCVKRECHYDGYCYVCPFGKTGRDCTDEVSQDDPTDDEVAELIDTYTKLIAASVLAGVVFVLMTALLCYVRQMRIKKEILQQAMKNFPPPSQDSMAGERKTSRAQRRQKKKQRNFSVEATTTESQPVTENVRSMPSLLTDFTGTSVEPTTVTSVSTVDP
ncbi:hypothetical protein Btru_056213 [Bulinus truncatus]|nr:hypothetical protein Btru_056213 [Bulinus truncatus]